MLGGTGNPISQFDVLTDDLCEFGLMVVAIHDVAAFKYPVVVKVKDDFGPELGQGFVNIFHLLHRPLAPKPAEQEQVNRLQPLVADGGDILNAHIVKFRVVVAKVCVRHFKAVETAPGWMGVVNDTNLHGVKIRRAAIADCPSQTSDDENLMRRYYEPSICVVDGVKTVDAIRNIGSGSIPVSVNS